MTVLPDEFARKNLAGHRSATYHCETAMRNLRALLVPVALVLLAACAPSGNPVPASELAQGAPAGFLLGLWHGAILFVTFVISLFSDAVGIYEANNTGWPYNLGYVLGVMIAFGGGGAGAKR